MANDTDEQDLVKALDNVAGAAANVGSDTAASVGVFGAVDGAQAGAVASPFPSIQSVPSPVQPAAAPTTAPSYLVNGSDAIAATAVATPVDAGPLASIKQDALVELRPLVDKLNVSSEEKFDTYLLLIRSTDDTSLIGPAHEAAKAITDETRRAEALLDIIKEIDYLSHPKSE